MPWKKKNTQPNIPARLDVFFRGGGDRWRFIPCQIQNYVNGLRVGGAFFDSCSVRKFLLSEREFCKREKLLYTFISPHTFLVPAVAGTGVQTDTWIRDLFLPPVS